jgi:hypothetical protein
MGSRSLYATILRLNQGKVCRPLWEESGLLAALRCSFTSATLLVGNSEIPVGAYSVYAIPEKRDWTLIINRDVKFRRGLYKESQDIARAPMQVGELPQSQQQTSIYFAHSPPKQCNMRIYAHMLRRRGHVGGVSREVTANGSHPSAPGHGRISKRPPTLY